MKKLVFMFVIMFGLSVASCGNSCSCNDNCSTEVVADSVIADSVAVDSIL